MAYLRLLLIPLALAFVACTSSKDSASPPGAPSDEARSLASNDDDATVIDVLLTNLEGLNTKNLDLAMSALDPDSTGYKLTKELTRQLFDSYELDYDLQELEVISRSDSEATVHFVQVTRKVSGPAFRDSYIEGVHLLRKKGGKWLLYETRQDQVRYLE